VQQLLLPFYMLTHAASMHDNDNNNDEVKQYQLKAKLNSVQQ